MTTKPKYLSQLTKDDIANLKVGDSVYLKHGAYTSHSKGETVLVEKIARKYIYLERGYKINLEIGCVVADYRGISPALYPSEQVYDTLVQANQFIKAVEQACAKMTFERALLINQALGLGIEVPNSPYADGMSDSTPAFHHIQKPKQFLACIGLNNDILCDDDVLYHHFTQLLSVFEKQPAFVALSKDTQNEFVCKLYHWIQAVCETCIGKDGVVLSDDICDFVDFYESLNPALSDDEQQTSLLKFLASYDCPLSDYIADGVGRLNRLVFNYFPEP